MEDCWSVFTHRNMVLTYKLQVLSHFGRKALKVFQTFDTFRVTYGGHVGSSPDSMLMRTAHTHNVRSWDAAQRMAHDMLYYVNIGIGGH